MKKPKALLFDLGDTILHGGKFEPEKGNAYLFSIIKDKKGVTHDEILAQVKNLNEDITPKKEASGIEVSWAAFNRMVFERFDLSLPISDAEAELEFWKRSEQWSPAPGVKEMLDRTARMGIPAGIISNAAFSGRTLSWELEKHGLLNYFKFVIASSDYGVRKPNPLLFTLAAAKIGASPEDIWFSGDNIECDIFGSRRVGMTPFYYIGRTGRAAPYEGNVIRNWAEMIEKLSQISEVGMV